MSPEYGAEYVAKISVNTSGNRILLGMGGHSRAPAFMGSLVEGSTETLRWRSMTCVFMLRVRGGVASLRENVVWPHWRMLKLCSPLLWGRVQVPGRGASLHPHPWHSSPPPILPSAPSPPPSPLPAECRRAGGLE